MATSIRSRIWASGFNLRFVVPSVLGFLGIAVLVMSALSNMAQRSNTIDDNRSLQAAAAAMQTVPDQLASVLRDNAIWDEAARRVYSKGSEDWFLQNWGNSSEGTSFYDTVFVLDRDNVNLFGIVRGQRITTPTARYFPAPFFEFVRSVRTGGAGSRVIAHGYVQTADGLLAVAVAAVLPVDQAIHLPLEEMRLLVFGRQINAAEVRRLSSTYLIEGIHLVEPGKEGGALHTNVSDPKGAVVASLAWPSRAPGDDSYRAVRPLVWAALGVVALIIALLIAHGWRSIAMLRANEAEARHLALHDPLTGLANRAGLAAQLNTQIERAAANSDAVTLLYFDLDGFKDINDAYGHGTGDQLLRGVAAGLAMLTPPKATLSRVGGDEFALVLPARAMDNAVKELAQTVLSFFSEPFELGERVAVVGASIGIATSIHGAVASEELVRRADLAMYQAKDQGGGCVVTYEPSMDGAREERQAIETDLRDAIARESLTIEYQPLVDARTHRLSGVEALVRWNRIGHGPVRPDIFVPIAESTGLIDTLGLYVLRQSCRNAKAWPGIKISVNVSPAQFRNPDFPARVGAVLGETDIDPARVTLEMTEGFFISHPARAQNAISALKALGVKISLDDFGSGFSSVGYLRQFGFDRMKIDRSLIVALDHDAKAGEMLQATVALAAALDIPVTAEGIEREDQAAIMRLSGCDELQGHLFGRAMPPQEITRIVARERQALLAPGEAVSTPAQDAAAA
jgi:diguanylate cyclase (GGDEF)-like protein